MFILLLILLLPAYGFLLIMQDNLFTMYIDIIEKGYHLQTHIDRVKLSLINLYQFNKER